MMNIIIPPADKGENVIIMNYTDYRTSIEQNLKEDNTYEQVKNPTNKIKKSLSETTEKLLK